MRPTLFSRPYGTLSFFRTRAPALQCWATFDCPYGTVRPLFKKLLGNATPEFPPCYGGRSVIKSPRIVTPNKFSRRAQLLHASCAPSSPFFCYARPSPRRPPPP